MAGESPALPNLVAISEPPPLPAQAAPTPPAPDLSGDLLPAGGASFQELVTLLSREHAREVGALKAKLERCQEKNNMPIARAPSQQDGAGRLSALSEESIMEVPGTHPRSQHEDTSEQNRSTTDLPGEMPRVHTFPACRASIRSSAPSARMSVRGRPKKSIIIPPQLPEHAPSGLDDEVVTPTSMKNTGAWSGSAAAGCTTTDASSVQGNLFLLKVAWSSELNSRDRSTNGGGAAAAAAFRSAATKSMLHLEEPPPMMIQQKKRHVIGSPTQPHRLAWELAGAILIFYDLFNIPLQGAFSPPKSTFSVAVDWFIMIFWVLNVPMSLTVGHTEHGVIVMDPRKILIKYLKTWFVLDLVVVVPDLVFAIAALAQEEGEDESGGNSVKLLRVLRLVRMVRLVRLVRLGKMFDTMNDLINSEYTSVIANIVKMMSVLVVINHLICCGWFAISSKLKDEPGTTWIEVYDFDEAQWLYQYTTSFHWSITQFTPSSMHIQPQNLTERTFAIIVVIFALVVFSYIVGSITGSLAQLRDMYSEQSKSFWDLRRYLAQNKVTERNPQLSFRIQKYLEHAWNLQQESKPVKDVKLMQLLSDQLTAELKYELAVHQLHFHPFLAQLCVFSSVTVHRLSSSALEHKLLAEGDRVFLPGEVATHMSIVVKGKFRYRRLISEGSTMVEDVDNSEDWIAEPALWAESWIHRGLLTAVEESDNLMIDSRKFCCQIKLNPDAYLFTCGYARNFLAWLNDMPLDDLSDVYQGEDVGEMCKSFIPTDIYGEYVPAIPARAVSPNASFNRIRNSIRQSMR